MARPVPRVPNRRELAILACISHGLDEQMTADTLGLPVETVRDCLPRVRYTLRAKTTTHAVAIALRHGLIP